mmetsp:Transcript_23562/g.54734  ORF Transcript_23562/g.54734 Transcript_23562/m.54734 type:complete len:149 (+) Transcript_23562:27-473(+)
MVLEDVLAPARFLATITQLVGVLTVLVNKEPYIQAALPTLYTRLEYETAAADCTLVLGLGVTCLVIELVSLLTGLTLFANNTNAVHFLFHAAGALGLWLFSMGRQPPLRLPVVSFRADRAFASAPGGFYGPRHVLVAPARGRLRVPVC